MGSPTVLVVDDDFLVRFDMAETLRDAGFVVLEAGDALGALSVLRTNPSIQLVCTDVQMPGELDGIDLARLVRERYPRTKVIVVSAVSQNHSRLPNVPFASKPFAASRLVALVWDQLGSATAAHRAAA